MGQVARGSGGDGAVDGGTVSVVPPAERSLTRQGQDRKADLLRHAEALFEQRGYANTRMIDIARSAGVAKALFYWYFESKEALFREIMLDMRERLRAAQTEATASASDPLVRLYAGVVASICFIAENYQLYGLIYRVSSDPEFASLMATTSQVHATDTAGTISHGQAVGLMRSDESALSLAHGTAGVVNQFVLQYASGSLGGDLRKAAHTGARYVIRAVAVDDDAAATAIAAGRTRRRKKR